MPLPEMTKRRKAMAALLALSSAGGIYYFVRDATDRYAALDEIFDRGDSGKLLPEAAAPRGVRGARSPDTDYYVSPAGSGTDCSIGSPCAFSYIIQSSNPRGVLGGDTIYMRAGTYTGAFIVAISGTPTADINIRNYPSEAVVIDNAMDVDPDTLAITGSYVHIQGYDGPTKSITITNTNTSRTFTSPLACYPLCRAGGVSVYGTGVKIIHTIIVNNGSGIGGSGTTAQGMVAYGNIIAYNGWQSNGDGLNRGHGHGAYLQNNSLTSRKTFSGNIDFWNFGYGGQFYGSSGAQVFGIDADSNVIWDNGRIATSSSGPNIIGLLVGGNANAYGITLTNNWLFAQSISDQPRQNCLDPSYGPGTDDITVSGNFVRCGKAISYGTLVGGTMTCTNNSFYGANNANATTQCTVGNGNTFDAFTASTAQVNQLTSPYDPTWARLVINNPSGASSVTWNPSNCASGDTWELRDAMDWDAAALQTLACSAGQSVTMTNSVTPNPPVGTVPNSPVNTGVNYRVFVLTLVPGTAAVEITTASPLVSGTQGSPYSLELTCIGGVPPYAWDVSAGALPDGLSLGAATGVISGTPTGTGESTFTARCTDDDMTAGTKPFSLTIAAAAAMSVTTTTLPNCPQNTAYSQPVTATGGVPPYTWTVFSGALPTGLTLGSSSGVISGTCSGSVAVASLVIRATDTVMTTADSGALTLSVLPNTTVPITCYVTGNGRRKKLYCNAPGLPITQHLTARVFDEDGNEVEEVPNNGGTPERQLILGEGQQLAVGDFSVLATSAGTTTEVEFSTATVGGTGSLLFVLPPAPNRGIDNVLIEYGLTSGLGTSVEVACSSTCLHSITGLTAGSVYFYRITWRDSMDATVMRGPIKNAIIQ